MATCVSDLLGFCYGEALANPVTLPSGVYYVVSLEGPGDVLYEMVDPAASSRMQHRISTTYMSYQAPSRGIIIGRVRGDVTKVGGGAIDWHITDDHDTMFGPVNWVLGTA